VADPLTLDQHSDVASRAAELARAIVSARLMFDDVELLAQLIDEALTDPELAGNVIASLGFLCSLGYMTRGRSAFEIGEHDPGLIHDAAARLVARKEFARLIRDGRTL
jgi:hypothetical protein